MARLSADSDAQRTAIAFLAQPESYGVANVERIDTHGAVVILAGDRAYKLKRAVRFSYMDFSTLERREAACRAEIVLNRRTAPDLYLDVAAITCTDEGTCAFNGAGPVIDWVVVMRRFDQEMLLDRMAKRGALDGQLMEALSKEIATFHAAAEPTPGHGGQASLGVEIDGNEENLAVDPPDAAWREDCHGLVLRWRSALDRHAEPLDRRDRERHVRRCHGDLHLRNIVLWDGRPTLFDAIEFNEHLSCIDVLYDLAFLLMDLLHREFPGFANLVFNAYLDRNDEVDGIGALPLMMSLRAAIRAHTGIAAARAQTQPDRRATMIDEARQYVLLANRLLEEQAPCLIAIGGLSGTGKSTLARGLAPFVGTRPGARLLHTDALRKQLFGVDKAERLDAGAYRPAVSEQVYALQREAAASALRGGYSVIADGVFLQPEERAAIAAVARASGVGFLGLWLDASPVTLRERVAARTGDMSDATTDVLELQLGHDAGIIDWAVVPAEQEAAETLAAARSVMLHSGRCQE